MKTEDLIKAFGDIDDDLFAEPDDAEEGFEIPIERERPHLAIIKMAAAAACFAVMAAGMFAVIRYRINEGQIIDSSTNAGDMQSYESSRVSASESSEPQDIDKESLPQETENRINIVDGINYEMTAVEKQDNYDYAVVYVDETNASEEKPISLCILGCGGNNFEDAVCVSETVTVTEGGKYIIKYSRLWGAGTLNWLECEPIYDDLVLKGTWKP